MLMIVLVVLLILALGGGGFFYDRAGLAGFSPVGLILVILVVLWFSGRFR